MEGRPMIARVWTAHATSVNAPKYQEHVAEHVLPSVRGIDGYAGVALLNRTDEEQVEIVVITFWRSLDAISRFAGTDLDQSVVADEAVSLLTTWDQRVRHYEVVLHDQLHIALSSLSSLGIPRIDSENHSP